MQQSTVEVSYEAMRKAEREQVRSLLTAFSWIDRALNAPQLVEGEQEEREHGN